MSTPETPAIGPLENPLAGWPNDDLLLTQAARDHLARHYPEALPVFDWPALRQRFEEHDPKAGRFRQISRRRGMVAAACGFSSLLIAALSPLLQVPGEENGSLTWWLGLAAALLAVAGGVIGYAGLLSGRTKWRWLSHRFWTERMRQLHFQLIANHAGLAARVIRGEADARVRWDKLRADTFHDFDFAMGRDQDLAIQRMRADLAENEPWLDRRWADAPPAPADGPGLATLFQLMKRQRFGIQRTYTERKLHSGFHSPRTRLRILRGTVEAMTVLSLVAALVLGIMLMLGQIPARASPRLLIAIGGGLTAGVMTLRMLEEGLQLRSETERYEWYLAAVEALERRFDGALSAGKAEILREMERLSYQELRRFTESFAAARFIL